MLRSRTTTSTNLNTVAGMITNAVVRSRNRLAALLEGKRSAKAGARGPALGAQFGSRATTKCPAPVQASARVAGGRPRVPSKFSFKWEPEHARGAAFLQATPTHATCQRLSTSLVDAEGRTVDVLPKKRADDPHNLPRMRCPSPTYHCQVVQPLQDALLRPRVPENTLGGRPR